MHFCKKIYFKSSAVRGLVLWKVLSTILYTHTLPNSILSTTEYLTALIAHANYMFCVGFFITFFLYPKGIDGISVYIFQRMWKGGEIMNTSSFEHIVRIQFNALMITIIKCTVKSKKRQFSRRSKREILFCELSDMKNIECQTEENYSCDYISFEVLNFTLQISNEKLAVALYKLSNKERDVILLHYFQSMSDQEIAELYHVSRSAIYRRRSNGLKKLKALLKERN